MAKCEHCNNEQEDFEIYSFSWVCDSCLKYNELPDGYCTYIVVPPKITKNSLTLHLIDLKKQGKTEEEAWENFLYPSLRKDGYEKDGFKAVKMNTKIWDILSQNMQ